MFALLTPKTRLSSFSRRLTHFVPLVSGLTHGRVAKHITTDASVPTQSQNDPTAAVQTPETQAPPTKRRRNRNSPWLRTLRPDRMVEIGQEPFSLYAPGRIYLRTTFGKPLQIGPMICKETSVSPGQKGVLYYHQDPSLSKLAGEIRFRYCDTVDEFDRGEDHMISPARPWSIRLPTIAQKKRHIPISRFLVEEGLVAEDVLQDLAQLPAGEGAWLYHLEQPFLFELRLPRLDCSFITRTAVVQCHFEGLYKDYRAGISPTRRFEIPYSGVIRVRWEVSTLPQHKRKGPTLVLRVLEVLTPVQSLVEGYDDYFQVPKPGTLVSRRVYDRGYEPCAFHLNRRANGPDILEFIRRTSPEKLNE